MIADSSCTLAARRWPVTCRSLTNPVARMIAAPMALAGRRRSRSDGLHPPIADENVSPFDHAIWKDDRSEENLIHPLPSTRTLSARRRGAGGSVADNPEDGSPQTDRNSAPGKLNFHLLGTARPI